MAAVAAVRYPKRVSPLDAFVRARQTYLRGRRLDMQELAADLGVSRATLYRWVGSREQLLGEILWSLGELGLKEAEELAASRGERGVERVVTIYQHFIELTAAHQPLRQFVANEPEIAMRILTSNQGVQHQRFIDYLRRLLEEAAGRGELKLKMAAGDLAFVLNRVGESFIWRNFITGEEPDTAKAEIVARLLLA